MRGLVRGGTDLATRALNSAAESQAAWREVEAGRGQRLTDRMVGAEHGLAVGLLDGDPPERPPTHRVGDGGCRPGERVRVVRPGEQGPPAALDIEDEVAVDENDDSTGLATRLVAAFGLRAGQGRAAP